MQENHEYKNFIVGDFPVVTITESITSSDDLPAGTILGRINGGELVPADISASDGREIPRGVLLADVKSIDDVCPQACIALTGEFNQDKLKVEGGTVEDCKWDLYKIGIFPKKVLK